MLQAPADLGPELPVSGSARDRQPPHTRLERGGVDPPLVFSAARELAASFKRAYLRHVDSPREPFFNVPPVVIAVIALLGLVHAVLVLVLSSQQVNDALLLFAFIPARYDASLPGMIWPGGFGAEIWTFVTYALIHADLNHLFFNAVWLLAFGTPVARRFGALRFLAFLLATAAAGAAVHLATHVGELLPAIGASAAISGAMAAAMRFAFQSGGPLGLLRRHDPEAYRVAAAPLHRMLREPRVIMFLLVWLGVNALLGLSTFSMPGVEQSVAWQAHIGGFLAGLFGFSIFDPVPIAPPAQDRPGSEPRPS